MRATGPLPAGATHDVGWRDPLAEQQLESGRIRFNAYEICTWLCGQVDPVARVVRPRRRQQTGLSPHRVEMFCRLRRTGHVDYRGLRARKRRALGGLVVIHLSLVDGADRARQHGGRA